MTSKCVWKDLPEINRRVGFTSNHEINPYVNVGCHCSSLSHITVYFGSGFYGVEKGKNIEVLDTEKEKDLVYTYNKFSGLYEPPTVEVEKVVAYLEKNTPKFDHMEGFYDQAIDRCSNIPMWIISDVVNLEAPVRKSTFQPGYAALKHVVRTADFVKYLIDKKIGYVMASPIIQNPAHRNPKNYSLNRTWLWIHPKHLERTICTTEVFGEDLIPTEKEWKERVGKDLGLKDEEVVKKVFESGVFPEIKKYSPPQKRRWHSLRGEGGRFIPALKEA